MRVPKDFSALLLARIRRRNDGGQISFFLDLRCRAFGAMGKLRIRQPGLPGWPDAGRCVCEEGAARTIVEDAYLPYIARELRVRTEATRPSPTVREACASYIGHLVATKGSSHSTTRNHRASLQKHIVPAFGDLPLIQLTRADVREFLKQLVVRPSLGDRRSLAPAKPRTKKALRIALLAVWRHAFPDEPAPFAGMQLKNEPSVSPASETSRMGIAENVRDGSPANGSAAARHPVIGPVVELNASEPIDLTETNDIDLHDAYSVAQITHLLTAALDLDLSPVSQRPNQRGCSTPNRAGLIAVEVCTGMRISETACWSWGHILEDYRAARATDGERGKTPNAHRWFAIQESLEPWLRYLWNQQVEMNGGRAPSPCDLVIRGHPKQPSGRASPRTLQGRIAKALFHAGLKQPGRLSHVFRATHISWGVHSGLIDLQMVKAYVGHENVLGGATDSYFHILPSHIRDEHRQYIKIPSPREIHEKLSSFRPGPLVVPTNGRQAHAPPEHPDATIGAKGPLLARVGSSRG